MEPKTENGVSKKGLSEEHKKKISESLKGIKRSPLSEECKRKIGESLKGYKHLNRKKPAPFTQKHKENLRKLKSTTIKMKGRTGEKNPAWKGGITPLNKLMRESSKMKIWRELVFLRDNFTCQNQNCEYCKNKQGIYIHAHHIKSFANYLELRFKVDNGITYCIEYHLKSGLHKNIQGGIKIGKKQN